MVHFKFVLARRRLWTSYDVRHYLCWW